MLQEILKEQDSDELQAQFADLSASNAQAESAKLEQAINANLKGLGYGE